MATTNEALGRPSALTEQHIRDQILSVRQLAEELQVPVKTIYAWRHQRTGPPSFRAGKYLRFRRTDVAGWIQAQLAADHDGAA